MARFGIALLILVMLPASTAGAVEQIVLDHQSELRIDGEIRSRLENAGDFDDDGIDDLLVLGSDRAYVVYGAPGYDYLDLSQPSARVSTVVTPGLVDAASLGDVNGDDIGDIAVLSSEQAWVIFGGHGRVNVETPVPPSRGYELKLAAPGNDSGYASRIFGVGNLNADGLADVAVGEPGAGWEPGRVTIVFGSTSSTPVDLRAPGPRGFRILGDEYDELGTAVAGPGDLDGDGRTDLVVKALGQGPSFSRPAVYAITLDGSGADIDLASGFHGFRIVGDPEAGPVDLSEFVAGAGDVDRDGLSDILLPLANTIGGNALVVRGSSSEETVTVRFQPGSREVMIAPPASPDHYFGDAVAGGLGGDWNGDGNPDLLLAFRAGAYVVGGPYDGRSFTVDEAGPVVSATLGPFPHIHYGPGGRVADGDFNGDGELDLALSAPVTDGFTSEPRVGSIYVAAGGRPRPGPGACVERQTGSPAADMLKGTNAGDLLETAAGPDELRGLDGADCLVAGEDDDVLHGEPGFDFLFGGPGRDLLDGGSEGDYLAGEAGDDDLRSGDGNDMLDPGPGVDSVDGGTGDDLLDTRDGESDQVDCGPEGPKGAGDFAYTDPIDTLVGDCSPYGPHIQLSDRWFLPSPYDPSPLSTGMAYDRSRDRFLVAWAEFTSRDEPSSSAPVGEGRVVARVVDGRGFALGPVWQVSPTIPVKSDQDPALMEDVAAAAAPDGTGFVVGWNEPQPDGRMLATSRAVRPNGAPYSAPGSVWGSGEIRGTTLDVVAARREDHLLAMLDTPGSRGSIRALGSDGSVVGPARRLRGPRRISGAPALAAGGRGFLLAWTGRAKDAPFARRLDASGRPAGPVRRLGRGRRCCTGGGAMALAYDPDRRRYLAAWEAQNGVRTVLVRRGGRPIRRPRRYEGSRTLEISDSQVAYGGGRFLLAVHELETTGDDRYPEPRDRTHAYWLNARGRRARISRPYAGPDFSLGASVGYSERERRFMIASLASGDAYEEGTHLYDPLRPLWIFARTWPGAPPE